MTRTVAVAREPEERLADVISNALVGFDGLAVRETGAEGFDSDLAVIRASSPLQASPIRDAIDSWAPTPVLVVVESATDAAEVYEILRSGASGVVDDASEPGLLVAAVLACLHGGVVLPQRAAELLAERNAPAAVLSNEEQQWLRALDAGSTIAAVAADAGYSERSMYRRLSSLYRRLDVDNRSGAVAEARRLGFL